MRRHSRFPMWSVAGAFLCALSLLAGGAQEADGEAKQKKQGKDKVETVTVKAKDVTLDVPKTWQQQPPENKFRAAQFVIPAAGKDKQKAELVVYYFGGGGGGVNANIKRWIGQFEQQKREVNIKKGKSAQGPYVLVDVTGTYNKPVGPPFLQKTEPMPGARMMAVVLRVKDKGNYFLKLTGPEKTVTKSAKRFRKAFGADPEKEEKYEPGNG